MAGGSRERRDRTSSQSDLELEAVSLSVAPEMATVEYICRSLEERGPRAVLNFVYVSITILSVTKLTYFSLSGL